MSWRNLELNGGRVSGEAIRRLTLPADRTKYADAQIDDYGNHGGLRWRPGTRLSLRARFSHSAADLQGTAGFGFWNAPYGDPTVRRLVLPQAVWFFFASAPNDLPFAPESPGRGWFAATVDTGSRSAVAISPLAPVVLLLNQLAAARQRIWPFIRQRLGLSFVSLPVDMTCWHEYQLEWEPDSCRFTVDGTRYLTTSCSPRGPLGLVIWIDNQYLILTPRGRLRSGVLPVTDEQWLEVTDLQVESSTKSN